MTALPRTTIFPDGLAVMWHLVVVGVHHDQLARGEQLHTLVRLDRGPLLRQQRYVLRARLTDGNEG
jgi:hypothetical protein